ncbi:MULTISPECIES: protein-ADP-ribose hydrolase [Aerococcus]|uniref:protein-ADP-ribose hydrolase n=1 Tax=Aerococcus TaxID=1375 RepID=UPI0018A76F03|nr:MULTISPECIES: protein-ADP-ribose hydrolase [Aerococcus]MCY3036873.1 protein-ADP-ribose hydrolase [Aerococcus sp. Group 2]MCY3040272.1 protein-ADP-ribose hydrolase [Aerococcus sp. Group 2]MCY3041976.1 protein-ADP-ribose hydrolase [Aerococcus sp. Group 2]MCY3043665.1 protein-ADP-ribose hydrolase [Aerococcus sp. Group 2]MDK6521324.1 protein-ADP-ribose hydrolase [Aerococcus urinae]
MTAEELLRQMIDYLEAERSDKYYLRRKVEDSPDYGDYSMHDKWRALINTRPAWPISEDYLDLEDEYLKRWRDQEGTVSLDQLEPALDRIYLWQGDICRLAVDGIVNAANSFLLGCFIPNHKCIDNTIQTRAGVRLRLALNDIMEDQGHNEPVGKVKTTSAYHLPAKYILHTVGPRIESDRVSPIRQNLLKQSYLSCLKEADRLGLKSLAFPCISTGEFHFPNDLAAQIAFNTVRDYLKESGSSLQVIFNVYLDQDLHLYQDLIDRLEGEE